MSASITTAATWQWPSDVSQFALKREIQHYLTALRDALEQLFPSATNLSVTLEEDPEIRDDWHIVFYVEAPRSDIPNYVEALHRWHDALFRICPAPLACIFRLCLISVAS